MIEWLAQFLGLSSEGLFVAFIAAIWGFFKNRQTEKWKNDFKMSENKASIRLQRISEKQLEVMIALYEKMADLDGNMQIYSGPWKWESLSNDSGFEQLFNDICTFQIAFYKAKVFLTPELESHFKDLIEVAQRTKVVYRMLKDKDNFVENTAYLKSQSVEDMKYMSKELPILRSKIESEYRKMWQIKT